MARRKVQRPAVASEHAERITAAVATVANTRARDDYARRIWDGQSPDLPRAERIRRVNAGLQRQGYDIDGLELP